MYSVFYSSQAEKSFLRLPDKKTKLKIKKVIQSLAKDPRARGVIKLKSALPAPFRLRAGNLRILFEINNQLKQSQIFDIRKRNKRTYK